MIAKSFTTDELQEGIRGLQKLAAALPLVIQDAYEWKWVLIIAHNSLQAFMVCAVQGSAGLGALTPKSASEWLEAYSKGLPYPEERLDFFLQLYEKIQGPAMKQFVGSKSFVPTPQQNKSVRRLNECRNSFIHFVPTGLLMYVEELPEVIRDVLDMVELLAKKSENVEFYEEPNEVAFDQALTACKRCVSEISALFAKLSQ